ncbi:zf-HC2 domain-containing protein [Undibacterium griseum]|uniref:zf-HC2 domain-containing protein n=1 Tax=Undibacterium griseum TaxID=2762295 RepID=UPI002E3810C7|nr:zf-HC2 domain-containing protein [Undibacterium griseum]
MLNCQNVTRLYSESQERPLTLQERMSVKMHVMMCSGCRNFGEQMHILRQAARTYVQGADGHADKTDE